MTIPRVLTVAGSDSGGGAGVQADLKTITVLGGFGTSAITALTAQNTTGVRSIHSVPPEFVADQIEMVLEDIGADAAKSGMLANAGVIEAVAAAFRKYGVPNYVLDPVMISKSGAALLDDAAVETMVKRLFPLARLVTPNLPEAERITGVRITSDCQACEAARRILALGPAAVLIKGGHAQSNRCVDLLYEGKEFIELSGQRVESRHTHGTGCTLSAAIATFLGAGLPLEDAVHRAREFVRAAIELAPGLGRGWGPLGHAAAGRKLALDEGV